MHQDIFGSAEKPFSLVADSKYFYRSASHGAAFDQLQEAIRQRDGFILVTGEVGSGKTTLIKSVLEQVDRKTFTSLIQDPSLSEDALLRVVLQDFGLVSRDELKQGRLAHASARELLAALDDFLSSLRPLGASALLVIDEAQEMPLETLDQISALGGPGGGMGKQLQIVLVGQPILKDLLTSPLVRELDGRVTTRVDLKPFTADETSQYVSHRLMVAGAGPAVDFAPAAVASVHRYSGGVPRLINMLCDGAMLSAQSQGATSISPRIVDAAAGRLELRSIRTVSSASPWSRKPVVLATAALIVVALIVAAYASIRDGADAAPITAPVASSSPVTQPSSSPTPVAPPPATMPEATAAAAASPSGQTYWVLVASFRQAREATALLDQLRGRGLPVREVRVVTSPRGVWHQVLVGPYPDAAAAARGQVLVRQIPGYADAHVISS